MAQSQLMSQYVAVIGGGTAGLAAAKELRREGHRVVVFERESQLGGIWVYNPQIESDPLGSDPNREAVQTSLYRSLRTNFPRLGMGFRHFPFIATGGTGRDSRRYPCHEEVLSYLQDFARTFKLNELVRYETEVNNVELLDNGKLKVTSTRRGGDVSEVDETFDAVVVCNGHYTQPQTAQLPGIENWPGKQIHSHNYRVPEPYENLVVVVIGSGPSAQDISRKIALVAKEVHVASRSATMGAFGKKPGYDNMWLHPMITSANEDGTLTFEDGSAIFANVILHCTGYRYEFPFLQSIDTVTVDDNRVGPLYKHVFSPGLAPVLSFVGIPWKVIPFVIFELQSEWIAGVLSGRISLPSKEVMMDDAEAFYRRLNDEGYEYMDWLASECGCASMEEWRKQMCISSLKTWEANVETYRDEWDEGDDAWIMEAEKDFAKYLTHTECSSQP